LRALAGSGLAAAVTLAASSACELVRPVDALEAHPDVVAIAVLLVAGESEARMLAVHPHRKRHELKPRVSATLDAPSWTARFSDELRLPACGQLGGSWHIPTRCLGARLPEAIRSGVTYGVNGTAPLGPFNGAVTVPNAPLLIEPEYSLWLPLPDEAGFVDTPIRYLVGSDVGTLLADVSDVYESQDGGGEVPIPVFNLGPFPVTLENAERDTVSVYVDEKPVRFALRLFGVGLHYTNFVKYTGVDPLPRPWPSFGLKGEGVYGYFDGLSYSRTVHISVGQTGDTGRAH